MPRDPRARARGDLVPAVPSVVLSPCFSTPPLNPDKGLAHLSAGFYAGIVLLLVTGGSLSLFPLWQRMCHLWSTDPLRSIGAAFPLVACVGVLVAWRRLGWCQDGSILALLPVALSMVLAPAVASTIVLAYNGQSLIHLGTVLFLYGSGAVLLFGGPRLFRASILPLCLLLLINPVPYAFNHMVDLPLQFLSALTARSFAHHIGLQPTGENLRMMFAPDFGMFIAPGCNGIRGSITLGYLALIFGYVRHLRPHILALVTIAAILLGYMFNLLRLCILVVYYRIGINFPSIQKHGVGVDYAIGCTMFLFAAVGLGLLIRSVEPGRASSLQKLSLEEPSLEAQGEEPENLRRVWPIPYAAVVRSICFVTLFAAFIFPEIRSATSQPMRPNEQLVLSAFPASVGGYRLTRTWAEHNGNGMIALAMAEYSAPSRTGNTVNNITLGIWMGSDNHLVADSKYTQGILAESTGSFDAIINQALPAHFVTSFYDDGVNRQYDAESACLETGCSDRVVGSRYKGFFFATHIFSNPAFVPGERSLPILLRREWPDSDPTPSADLRIQFEADARLFMEQLNLQPLLVQDGSHL